MNEQSEQIKKNFLDQWIRLAVVALYIIAFALLWPLIATVLLVLIILQSLHRVIASENNKTLLAISDGMSNLLFKILQYVLYLSDEKPIDFEAFFSRKYQDDSAGEETAAESFENDRGAAQTKTASRNADKNNTETATDTTDDVFADISFTEKDADLDEDDSEQPKKPE